MSIKLYEQKIVKKDRQIVLPRYVKKKQLSFSKQLKVDEEPCSEFTNVEDRPSNDIRLQ